MKPPDNRQVMAAAILQLLLYNMDVFVVFAHAPESCEYN